MEGAIEGGGERSPPSRLGGGSPQLYCSGTARHTTRAPPIGFELATNGIQFYVIANLDKTSLLLVRMF